MIDMHCHILPGIDDGSPDIEESIRMAIRAVKAGYSGVFATSHYMEIDLENEKELILKKVIEVNKRLHEDHINFEVYPGHEVYFTPNIPKLLEENKICTLGNSKYLLMELPMVGKPLNTELVLEQIISMGYVPIIAHPERYDFVNGNIKSLYPLLELGALMQINAGSIEGIYGTQVKKNVIQLLKNNMVHFVGTDAHDFKTIYNPLESAMEKINKLITIQQSKMIFEVNPNAVKSNKTIFGAMFKSK